MEKTPTKITGEILQSVLENGFWESECPYCGAFNPSEPDAREICCQTCDELYMVEDVISHFI